MCTVVVLTRPGHAWPLLLAANRDERVGRPWDPPGSHWAEHPGLVAGRDRLGGGTWMAMADGVVAAVLNRPGSLGPQQGKRSRGGLPLLAGRYGTAAEAAHAVAMLDASEYRTFNLVVADASGAWFVRGTGQGRPEPELLAPGLHMVTSHDPDDPGSLRVAAHLPRFRASPVPDPARGWEPWNALIADRSGPRAGAINVPVQDGYGTVCSSLAGVSQTGRPVWLFAAGPPDVAPFQPVSLP